VSLSRVLALAAAAAAACNPYDPNLGPEPFLCGTDEPRCPDGYACAEDPIGADVCVPAGSLDASSGDGGLVDCSADADLEPNETTADPSVVPIPDLGESFVLAGAAICGNDRDVFRFRVDTTGKNARLDLAYDSRLSVVQLELDLLNSTGVSIRSGTPVGGDPDTLRADFANLAAGDYYAQVQGADGDEQAHYDLTFLVTANPLP
jgi:hypothetical protein